MLNVIVGLVAAYLFVCFLLEARDGFPSIR